VRVEQHRFSEVERTSSVPAALWKSACAAIFAAGLIPLIFICWLIVSTGANNVCVDYAAFLHVVDKVLSGQYQWLSIFSDSFIRTHMVLLPVLVHTAIAYTTHWDVTSELYIGMSFHVLRAFLIADLLTHRIGSKWTRLAVSGGVFGLVFAMSQTCIMIYGEASIAIGLSLLGFTFAVWALCKYGRTPRGLALMMLGGVASSYSFGNLLPCWLALLVSVFLLPARGWVQQWERNTRRSTVKNGLNGLLVNRKVALAYWSIGALVSFAPYYFFLAQRAPGNPELTKTFGLFDPVFVLNALGRPFAKDMGLNYGRLLGAEISAGILVALVVALAVPLLVSRVRLSNVTRICMVLFAYGFLSVWTVGVFRTHIAPWYASMSLYCWIAVFGVCAANLHKVFSGNSGLSVGTARFLGGTSLAGIAAMIVLYFATNVSYTDKQFFLNARAPVSAEYLRTFETAPTFLESTVFSNDGRPDRIEAFAGSLKRHDLCVFSPDQTWSLQGQFALNNVDVERVSGSKRVMWLNGRSLRGAKSWRDYHHLNLLVPEGNVVQWRITVPATATEAVFRTSVTQLSEPAGHCAEKPAKVVSTIAVSGGASYVTFCDDSWKPVQLNLLPYRGKSVTIRLRSSARGDVYSSLCDDKNCIPSSVLFMYPHVDVSQAASPNLASDAPNAKIVPTNTDVSPSFPRSIVQRFDLPSLDSDAWTPSNVGLQADTSKSIAGRYWLVPEHERVAVDEYDYLMMQLEPLPGKSWCSIKMHLQFDDGTTDGFSMPLLHGQENHSYVYPVKLLTQKGGAKLVGVLAFASAVDAEKLPKKFQSNGEVEVAEPQGVPLCGCIRVSNLAFIK